MRGRRDQLATAAVILFAVSNVAAMDLRVKPYVQNPSQDAMTVTWLTDDASSAAITISDVERSPIDARLSAGNDLHRSVDRIAVADAESIPPVPWQMAVFAPTT